MQIKWKLFHLGNKLINLFINYSYVMCSLYVEQFVRRFTLGVYLLWVRALFTHIRWDYLDNCCCSVPNIYRFVSLGIRFFCVFLLPEPIFFALLHIQLAEHFECSSVRLSLVSVFVAAWLTHSLGKLNAEAPQPECISSTENTFKQNVIYTRAAPSAPLPFRCTGRRRATCIISLSRSKRERKFPTSMHNP